MKRISPLRSMLWLFSLLLSSFFGGYQSASTFFESRGNHVLPVKNPAPIPGTPPPYMLHLYHRWREGRAPRTTANTVRSFLPSPGQMAGQDILLFNLTDIHPSEYIEQVNLHLRWDRPPERQNRQLNGKGNLPLKFRLRILDLSRPSGKEIQSVFQRQVVWGGWQALDLTDSIIACLESAERYHLVGIMAEKQDTEEEEREATIYFNSSEGSALPFLVVFSQDDDHLFIDGIDRTQSNGSFPVDRRKRELLNNELPDYPWEGEDHSGAEIQARMKHRSLEPPSTNALHLKPKKNSKGKTKSSKQMKRKRRRRRQDRRLRLKWNKRWWNNVNIAEIPENDFTFEDGEEDDENDEEMRSRTSDFVFCKRKKFVVDFAEIGWGDWVISPEKFDSYYCAGDCSLPLVKVSNHAMLQSLMHQINGNVPRPCCVPRTFSTLPLLYRDQNNNIVLKSFPDMIVETCSCQ